MKSSIFANPRNLTRNNPENDSENCLFETTLVYCTTATSNSCFIYIQNHHLHKKAIVIQGVSEIFVQNSSSNSTAQTKLKSLY